MSLALQITKDLMEIPSITPNDHGCQAILKQYLTEMGFTITDIPCGEASNFWATHGTGKPYTVFAGHTDVVATGPLELWLHEPFKPIVKKGILYGRGAADMKSSLGAMIVATQQFLKKCPHHPGTLGFLITSAEEGPSELGTPVVLDFLKQNNIALDYCIVGEPTASQLSGDTIKNGRRGSLSGKLIVKGKQGHIAYPDKADNPIHRALAALDAFTKIAWDNGNEYFPATSLQISNIHGGTGALNVIPNHLDVDFNFRYCSENTAAQLEKLTHDHFNQYGFDYHIQWIHYGKPYLTRENTLIDAARLAIEKTCGMQPLLSTTGGTSDGRYIAEICSEIIELGPCNKTIHQINEHIRVDDIDMLVDIYENLLEHLLMK